MDTTTPPSLPGNRINVYLQTLIKVKKGLPFGQPVSLIGPHIAILQVHADIIDDWSYETACQLTSLSQKYGFLLWESSRLLNASIDVIGRIQMETREMRNEMMDLIRKTYTRGIVKTASWSPMASAWSSGVPINNQEADLLIPTLRTAAREAVSHTLKTIQTEITTERPLCRPESGASADENAAVSARKQSTISLTQTITQHTEDVPQDSLEEKRRVPSIPECGESTPCSAEAGIPPPPIYARGLVLVLPSMTQTLFKPEYRRTSIAAARANQDFVLGFISPDPWQVTSKKEDMFEDIPDEDDDTAPGPYSTNEENPLPCLSVYSIIPYQLGVMDGKIIDEVEEDEDGKAVAPSPSQVEPNNPIARRIFYIVEQALKSRDGTDEVNTNPYTNTKVMNGRKLLHCPIIAIP
ncbi:hypothetical protein EYZ11_004551 [Aspergillus tanneri]|uniref:Uncharacterized protein n=1 Tax=Aspergillus tanneri TaxID=1220188 RepID=A0A4V3UPP3_9EURO|nr:hypothetical protein EYZ11_004551 [Aspergillus tanneri]